MADPTKLDAARAALAVHDHHPREVCPECCDDVCDPCVDALRWALVEIDRLTADLATARATGRREGLEEAAEVCRERAATRENAAEQMHETGQYRDATTYRTYAAAERALAGTLSALAAKVTP